MTLLLGIDEGTSAVKAVLYDADLRPLAEARREKALAAPAARLGGAGPRGRARRRSWTRSPSCSTRADGEVAACGLDHQGESVLAWDAESGRPLTPIVTWQDKRSQEVLDRLEADGPRRRGARAQRDAARPLLLGRQARLAARARRRRWPGARDAGTLRLGTVDSLLCDRLGAGLRHRSLHRVAHAARAGRPTGTRELLEAFGVPGEALPAIADTAGDLGVLRHELAGRSCRCARAAWTSRPRSRAPAAWSPGASRRPTAPACSCSRTPATSAREPSGGLLPTVAWRVGGRVEYALDGGVFTAGALLEWLSRDLGLAADPPALAALAAEVEDAGGRAGAAGARRARRALVAAGRARGDRRADRRRPRPAHVARAALEAIAWRVADVLAAVRESAPVEMLRVDGGLTRDPLLLQLQADAAGVAVERGAVDATAAGAAALAAVGAGV